MDRLELIESRWCRGRGLRDDDVAWLIEQVKALRAFTEPIRRAYEEPPENSNVAALLSARCRQPRRGWLARLWRWVAGRGHAR